MDSPLTLLPPTDYVERITAFARDLAYGVVHNLWKEEFLLYEEFNEQTWRSGAYMLDDTEPEHPLYQLIVHKWQGQPPAHRLLAAFGYFEFIDEGDTYRHYILTPKAFALLEQPATPPSVFISYRRSESSALGLLIEARLKLAGNPNPFIDKNLVVGETWNTQLEQRIREARYFVCLIGPQTLASPHVMQEITWAEQSGCTVISLWHSGATIDTSTPAVLSTRHAITVKGDSALDYELAVNQLLNSMGYATY